MFEQLDTCIYLNEVPYRGVPQRLHGAGQPRSTTK
jgi:hypothetical protein